MTVVRAFTRGQATKTGRLTRVAVVVAVVGLLVVFLVSRTPWSPNSQLDAYRTDLDVYRSGARYWLSGHALYVPIPTMHGGTLPFLYPPLSAILFVPFALQPFKLASVEITLLSVFVLAIVVWVALRNVRPLRPTSDSRARSGYWSRQWLLLCAVLPVAVLFEPVRSTLGYGQVNLLLMGLIAADCLVARPRWPRGVLIGLAAAIKLTPLAFLLFFLLRKDWRSALRVAASFAVCAGIGLVLDWYDSINYWTKVAYQTNRIGLGYVGNESITAVLIRFGVHSPLRGAVWLVLVAMVVLVAALAMRRAFASGHLLLALALNGVVELLCSPISWTHHWVWSVPLVFGFAVLGWRRRAPLALAVALAGLALFTLAPMWSMPNPKHWGFWEQLAGNSYVYFGALVLVGVAFVPLRLWRRQRGRPVPNGDGRLTEPGREPATLSASG